MTIREAGDDQSDRFSMSAWSIIYVDCDDDAFSRGTHKARVSAQIEAGLVRFKARKDHRTLAVRTERTLASRFSVKKRGNGAIEHNTLPWLGGSATLSVTDRCRDGAVISHSRTTGSGAAGQYCSHRKS